VSETPCRDAGDALGRSGYLPRLIDPYLTELLDDLPAVVIDGAKGVGKTRTATRLAASTYSLVNRVQRATVEAAPELVAGAVPPVLLDEWQKLPWLWDYVKTWVDEAPTPGRFLLTGSATPRGVSLHSGAGRIVRVRMRPLSLAERQLTEPTVSLSALLDGAVERVAGASSVGLEGYVHEIVASGFPALRPMRPRARQVALDGYVAAIVEREFAEQGLLVRKPDVLMQWLRAYAAATGSTASYSSILDAATPGEAAKPAASTTLVYRDILTSLWMIDAVPAWLPAFSQFGALGKTPKHYLADPALAARLLRVTEDELLRGTTADPLGPQHGTVLGRLFEALVALSLQTYASVIGANLYHLRTSRGEHEVDFIVERDDRVVAIEVKLAQVADTKDVLHLAWLATKWPGDRLTRVVVTTGPQAYSRPDGVHVVPAALLGP